MSTSTVPYRLKFSKPYQCFLAARLRRYYLWHFWKRPYRKDVPVIGYRHPSTTYLARRRSALYDAMFNIILEGYTELTEHQVAQATGQMLLFLRGLLISFDDCFEYRTQTGASLQLNEILQEASVRQKMQLLDRYLQLFGRSQAVMKHLYEFFADYYDPYVEVLIRVRNIGQFEDVRMSAHYDSGLLLRTTMEMVALFNEHIPNGEMGDNFYALGMAGKFADDIVDLVRDARSGTPNLVYALAAQNKADSRILQDALLTNGRMGARWWMAHCPTTYKEYFEYIEGYYKRLTTPKLRFGCDLKVLPAIIGYDYDATA